MRIRIRKRLLSLCALLAGALGSLAVSCKASPQLFTSSCKTDEEVSAKEREIIDPVALKFVQDALSPETSTAYATFTADAQKNVPVDRFVSGFQNGVKPMGPFRNLRVVHTYVAKVTGGVHDQRVVCGNLSDQERWVAVAVKPGPAEAHVIVEGQTINNTAVFVIWLIPENGTWRVQYVDYALAETVGKSAFDLRGMAEAEKAKQHKFNAFILYETALQLADRGPFFQLGIQPEIQKAIGNLERPAILQGRPPFIWSFDTLTFKVLNAGAIGVGGKIYLVVDHELEPWKEDKEADQENRKLMMAFAKAYPEYKDAFAGLVVRAHERGLNRGFTTVEESQK